MRRGCASVFYVEEPAGRDLPDVGDLNKPSVGAAKHESRTGSSQSAVRRDGQVPDQWLDITESKFDTR